MIQGLGIAVAAIGAALVWSAITGQNLAAEVLAAVGVASPSAEPARVPPYRAGSEPVSPFLEPPVFPGDFPR